MILLSLGISVVLQAHFQATDLTPSHTIQKVSFLPLLFQDAISSSWFKNRVNHRLKRFPYKDFEANLNFENEVKQLLFFSLIVLAIQV